MTLPMPYLSVLMSIVLPYWLTARIRIGGRVALAMMGLAAAACQLHCPAIGVAGPSDRPNVVLIMADDFGYECLGCNGSTQYRTPNLDQLAQDGARFTHCYSQPLCTPTRVQIMTGRYNFRNYDRFGFLRPGEQTFGHMLQAGGYATAVVGKWQLGSGGSVGQSPQQAGFDEYCLWNLTLGNLQATGDRYADANLIYRDSAAGEDRFKKCTGEYGPDVCAAYVADFIERSVRRKQPFLAYCPMILTHGPFQPTPQSKSWTANRHARRKRHFVEMVEYMDVIVGRIVEKLDALGIRDRTLILFTGDNGTPGDIRSKMHDGRVIEGGKGFHRDAGTHVPLLVNWKGRIAPGQVRDELVDMSDFLPTIAAVTGARLPRPPGDGIIDGRDFLGPLLGRTATPRTWVLVHYVEKRQDDFGWPRATFVRNRRYKLYHYYEHQAKKTGAIEIKSGQLYDLDNDPDEKAPLVRNPQTNAIRARLQKALDGFPEINTRESRRRQDRGTEATSVRDP